MQVGLFYRERTTVFTDWLRSLLVLICLAAALGTPLRSEDGSDLLTLGVKQLRSGSTFASARTLRQAVKEGNPRAHLFLAEAYFVLNQHALFAAEIAAAKAAAPTQAEPYYIEGRHTLLVEGNAQTAVEQFKLALSRDPEHIKAQCYLGIALRNLQRHAEAEEHLKTAVQLAETVKVPFYLPYQTLAEHYLDQGNSTESERCIKVAVKLSPEVPLNQFLLGKILWARSQPADAVAALRSTIQLDEAFLEARYLLARILEKQGDTIGSKQEFAQFQALKEVYGAGRLR
ncbi:MAG: tetratricopeptide repeat protein [Bryobacteraceae bacterium]